MQKMAQLLGDPLLSNECWLLGVSRSLANDFSSEAPSSYLSLKTSRWRKVSVY